jgi:site-specific recombinase XerD
MALLSDDVCIDFSQFPGGCISGLTIEEVDVYFSKIESERKLKEIDKNIQEAHSCLNRTSTAKQTKFYVQKFKEFLRKEGIKEDFETAENETLLKYLQFWLLNSKKKDGTSYKPQTYNCMKAAIHRHILMTTGRTIIGNPDFEQLKITQNACTTKYLEEPKTTEEREAGYKAIEEKDMSLLNNYFNRSDPTRLQREVIFNIIWHFGFRGREWLRGLNKDSVIFSTCPTSGLRYVDLRITQLTKSTNCRKPDEKKSIIMYEKPGDAKCPVQLMKRYLELFPPTVTCLFPKPLKKFTNEKWYSDQEVVGKNTLCDAMKNISKDASLSKTYTNHCIRASVVTNLSEAGVPPQEIQLVTGHRKIETVQLYDKKVSVSKRIRLSHKLTDCMSSSHEQNDLKDQNAKQQNISVEISSSEETLKDLVPVAVMEKDGIKLSFYM